MTDDDIMRHFATLYHTVSSANVILDPATKRSKRYGFVRFTDHAEGERALSEQNGQMFMGKPLQLKMGHKKGQQP